jgi:dimethylargininase
VPQFTHALVRPPSRSLAECQLLHLPRQPFDFERALAQHAAYVAALEQSGLTVSVLPDAPELPDAAFVEDVLIALDGAAILCRPRAQSRLAETEIIRPVLSRFNSVSEIRAPGTLEGGDVLRIGRRLFVGQSTRTNAEGIRQLRAIAEPLGFQVREVQVKECLHLKTALTAPRENLIIANLTWIDRTPFHDFDVLSVPEAEPWGANVLPINGTVLAAAAAPGTAELLRKNGVDVQLVDVSELQKAEAGLTCLSVLW